MANFRISVDITMGKDFVIEAANEDEARAQLEEKLKNNPYACADRFDSYVGYDIVDVCEDN